MENCRLMRNILLNLILPIEAFISRILHLKNDKVERFFVDLNNKIVLRQLKKAPERILLLMPHCLQFSDCEHRVTGKEIRCKMCGKCEIKDLVEISKKYDVKLSVATGGTMARNIVKNFSPDVIIATACERDLISGLRDTVAIPAIGILNERPNGPCVDTRVDMDKISYYIKYLKGLNNEKK